MHSDSLQDCLDRLHAQFTILGRRWDTAISDVFAEVLADAPRDLGEQAVRIVCAGKVVPHPSDIRDAISAIRKRDQAGRAAGPPPGWTPLPAGVTPYDLMREGFLDRWAADHPDRPDELPEEWLEVLRRIDAMRGVEASEDDPYGPAPLRSARRPGLSAAERRCVEAEVAAHNARRVGADRL